MRGTVFRGLRQLSKKGVLFGEATLSCDITPELCAEMKWDSIYKPDGTWFEGFDDSKLPGKVELSRFTMVWNGQENVNVEAAAIHAKNFKAYRHPGLIELRFVVVLPYESVVPVWEHWLQVNDRDSLMKLFMPGAAQESIDYTAEHETEVSEDAAASDGATGPALGSALHVIGGGSTDKLKKARQRRRTDPAVN